MKKFFLSIFTLLLLASNSYANKITIAFQVDMRKANVTDKNAVGIRGNTSPLSWKKSLPLTDADNDGIYTGSATFDITESTTLEYKFLQGDKWEDIGGNHTLNLNENVNTNSSEKSVFDVWGILRGVGFFKFEYNGKLIDMSERMELGEQVTHGMSVCVLRKGVVDTSVHLTANRAFNFIRKP